MRPSRTTSDTPRPGALLIALASLAFPAGLLSADEVYKSIDAQGHVVYSDHADASTAQSVVEIEGAAYPPRVLHFCWTNCFTLRLDNGLYRRIDGSDETWTIERFAPASVVLHRHDAPAAWNGFSPDVTYQGQASNDQLINVSVNGRLVPDINMAWGSALATLPGSNAERDRDIAPAADGNMRPADDGNMRAAGGDMSTPDGDMSAADAPPVLLNDVQPPCPEDGYLWTPGYWSWGGGGYYWVPGAWMRPPRMGVLWTPGYWGFVGGVYLFHRGYWGPHIGYYGGINYGFGYSGVGFAGGRWVGNSFAYNRAVNNVNVSVIHNTYNETVINNVAVNKVSYNGPGGSTASPTAQEKAAAAEPHLAPTPLQQQRIQQAAGTPALRAQAVVARSIVTHGPADPQRVAAAHAATPSPARVAAVPSEAAAVVRAERRNPQLAPQRAVEAPRAAPPQPPAPAQPAAPKPSAATARKPQPHPKP